MSEHGTQQHLSDFIQAFQQGNHFSKMASFVLFKMVLQYLSVSPPDSEAMELWVNNNLFQH
jgi:hypothetical protein